MTSGRPADQAHGYDPGNSFTEEALPAPQTSELPSWLQNFAEMTGEPPHSPTTTPLPPAPPSVQPVQAIPDDAVMPGWLDSAKGEPQPTPSALTEPSPIGGADFFSEDDLPEWLRALSSPSASDTPAPSTASYAAVPAAMPTGNAGDISSSAASRGGAATLMVPTVARVWITEHDAPEPSAAASMFAEVAEVADLRPDVLVSESPTGIGAHATPAAPAPVIAVEKTPRAENSWSWAFRLVVLMLMILAVIALVYMNLVS